MDQFVQVAMPVPIDQLFTYRVPAELSDRTEVGCRVVVPFGKRTVTAVVVNAEAEPYERSKNVADVLDPLPAFTTEMLDFTAWMANYYCCTWGEVLRAALPAGIEVESQRLFSLIKDENQSKSPIKARDTDKFESVRGCLEKSPDLSLNQLNNQTKEGVSLAFLHRMIAAGHLKMQETIISPKVNIKKLRHLRLTASGKAASAIDQLRGIKQQAILQTLQKLAGQGIPEPVQSDVLREAQTTSSSLKGIIKKGFIEQIEKEAIRTPLGLMPAEPEKPVAHQLHAGQINALEAIHATTEAEEFATFLLHGVTGSGKTEVYISALKKVLEKGKTGIILVPEISLTPQTVRRFRAHFGNQVAVLHSKMSAGERYDAWRQLRAGKYKIVIGPRSAIFAPLENLGIIIVDEEHETSYKQFDPAPRYHARDAAVMRAHKNKAVCILGSATPSLESWMNCNWGKYQLLSMPERVPVAGKKTATLPPVKIIDLTVEKKSKRLLGDVAFPLREAIKIRLEKEEQVILLLNRRGYAPVVECEDCGWAPECPDCAVTLTYHKSRNHLRCHYCGFTAHKPQRCNDCGQQELNQLGTGTQKVEEELIKVFPDARVLRMDVDTTRKKNGHQKILDQFGDGEADILIGTQMVAKGLDFGRVTLVGVINADTGLLLPDFRANEKSFQLLTQVAGRAGRSALAGEVFLQTRNRDNAAIYHAKKHNFKGFIAGEIPQRMEHGFPPFTRMIGIEFRGQDEQLVLTLARRWTSLLNQIAPNSQVRGPSPASVGRVKRQFRYQTFLSTARNVPAAQLRHWVKSVNKKIGRPAKDCRIIIDVDPVGMF